MKKVLAVSGLSAAIVASGIAQSYESQGRATGRRAQSWFDASRVMGLGEDWLTYPTLDVSLNTQFQYSYQRFKSLGRSSNLVNTTDLTATLRFAPRLAVYSDFTFDQINGPNPGEDSWFGEEGIFSSSLFLQYSNQFVTLGGGQFTPNFGIANGLAPGIFGGDFVGDYSFDDQLGFFGALEFGREKYGRHIFNASVFAVDRTSLSNSVITPRGRTTAADGGPGNTGSLDSFTVSYNGIDVPIFGMPILQYELGFISQAPGEGDTGRQYGYVAGAAVTIPFNRDALATASNRYNALQPLVEYARFENWSGVNGATADYLTFGLEYFQGDWDLSVSTTLRNVDGIPSQQNADDYLIQASIGYQLYGYQALGGNGQISVGWSYRKDNGQDSNMVAVQLSLGWDILNRFQLFKGW
jgi:hypothetical protein